MFTRTRTEDASGQNLKAHDRHGKPAQTVDDLTHTVRTNFLVAVTAKLPTRRGSRRLQVSYPRSKGNIGTTVGKPAGREGLALVSG